MVTLEDVKNNYTQLKVRTADLIPLKWLSQAKR